MSQTLAKLHLQKLIGSLSVPVAPITPYWQPVGPYWQPVGPCRQPVGTPYDARRSPPVPDGPRRQPVGPRRYLELPLIIRTVHATLGAVIYPFFCRALGCTFALETPRASKICHAA